MALTRDQAGRVLGDRYRLLALLGTGASAQVFEALDLRLERRVALKVLHPALAHDEAFLGRFRAEAHAAASLNHPNVLAVYDWGEDEGGPYLVLEYLGGGSLRHLLDRGHLLDPLQAARVGAEAAEGLAYAHDRGLVHRDVKPANLLFDADGRVRVADFGVARALAQASFTDPGGGLVGTARYASPEQAGGRALDGRSDVYALALVLHEAVTGTVPFTAETAVATLFARVGRPLPREGGLGPLADLVVWAGDPDAACRPDAATLARHLAAVASSGPVRPLPLAPPGSGAGDVTLAGRALTDASLTGVVPVVSDPAATAVLGRLPEGAELAATSMLAASKPAPFPTAVVPKVSPPSPSEALDDGEGPRRRSRWPWVLGLLGVALLLAAGALWAVRVQLFTPSHPAPALAGLTLPEARQAARGDHFVVVVSKRRSSIVVPTGAVIAQEPAAGTELKEGSTISVVVSKGLPLEQVPPLAGLDCAAAQRVLAVANLYGTCPPQAAAYSATVPGGQVISWSFGGREQPTKAPWHATITLAISEGPPPVTVPSVSGLTYAGASAALTKVGFKTTEVQEASLTTPPGEAVGTQPPAGTQAPQGSTVTVEVSSGPPKVTVPANLSGLTLGELEAVLSVLGLKIGTVSGPRGGVIKATVPGAGQSVAQGSSIDVTLRHGPTSAPSSPLSTTSTTSSSEAPGLKTPPPTAVHGVEVPATGADQGGGA